MFFLIFYMLRFMLTIICLGWMNEPTVKAKVVIVAPSMVIPAENSSTKSRNYMGKNLFCMRGDEKLNYMSW